MNSYSTGVRGPSTQAKTKRAALFAPEAYAEDDAVAADRSPSPGAELARLRFELRAESRALRTAMSRPRVAPELVAEIATLRGALDELLSAPKRGDAIATLIRRRGIEGAAASALARTAKRSERGGDIEDRLRAATSSLVRVAPWPPALTDGKVLLGLVGPAGTGKTTTAAKLAARAKMERKSVAFVSCDGFRVGALDQLASYAELMSSRFHVANTREELFDIVASEDADVVIVDTPGRPIDAAATEGALGSSELRGAGRRARRAEVLLCIAASLRASDAARVHRDFTTAKPTSLAVTKLDETDVPAGILHASFATRLPVSTLATGQRVPEDIAPATSESIAARLFPRGDGGEEL